MYKKLNYILFAVFLFFCLTTNIKADDIQLQKNDSNYCTYKIKISESKTTDLYVLPTIRFGKYFQGNFTSNSAVLLTSGSNVAEDWYQSDSKSVNNKIILNDQDEIARCPEICYQVNGSMIKFMSKDKAKELLAELEEDASSDGCTAKGTYMIGETFSSSASITNNMNKEKASKLDDTDVLPNEEEPGKPSKPSEPGKDIDDGKDIDASCDSILSNDAMELIKEILGYIQFLGPTILIILMSLDFGQAVLSQDEKLMKKSTGKVMNRILATIGLFLVPTFVKILLNLPGVRDVMEKSGIVDNPLCTRK